MKWAPPAMAGLPRLSCAAIRRDAGSPATADVRPAPVTWQQLKSTCRNNSTISDWYQTRAKFTCSSADEGAHLRGCCCEAEWTARNKRVVQSSCHRVHTHLQLQDNLSA